MAEIVVNFALDKLADAAVKDVLLLHGVYKRVEMVTRELIRIQAFLKDADSKQITDERQKNWVREIRDVGYSIEDVIDNALLLEDSTQNPEVNGYFARAIDFVGRMFKKQKMLPALHQLEVEMDQILTRIEEINESRIRYGINNLGEGSGGCGLRQPTRLFVLPDIDDPTVVGFDADTDNIVNQLLDEGISRRSVVSIVGVGGLGKTTLARKAYNRIDIKTHFNHRLWVTVSKEFKLLDLLKKIVKQFQTIDPNEHEEDEEYFLTKLHECCKGKKYLIVLDDVWTNDLWTQMEIVLPDENNGSRVLVTTRSLDVAKKAGRSIEPYQLKFLSEESSFELLLKKALPNQYPSKKYPNDLVDLAKKFVKKCGGLPLALMVLGGLLSKKSDYIAWNKVMQTMNWSVDGKACTEVLASSFEDLPLVIKPCFMYLALFPEDASIDAKSLVRKWIALGFIPEEKDRTLEDTGENFLEELVERCMIQVYNLSPIFGDSIKYCTIHDLLRDLAIQKAKDDNFVMVSSNVDDLVDCCNTRHLAIHHSNCDELTKYASKNLRSLLCFGLTPNCSKQRLLKVLRTEEVEFKWLEGSTQLRYFELNNWKDIIEHKYFENFERFLCSMKFLETLDLQMITNHPELPDCLWHVKTLRHVMLVEWKFGPPSWADLRNLQTLTGIRNRNSWSTEGTPNLPNLRKLNMQIVEGLSLKVMTTLPGTLKQLKELRLVVYDVPFEIPDMRNFSFYPHLECLHLRLSNKTSTSLDANMFPIHLTELSMSGFELNNDPMPILEKLQNLKTLTLLFLPIYHKRKMRFSAHCFVQLESLELVFVQNLCELEIEEGAMSMLKKLVICGSPQLRVPLGLKHLTSLQRLDWATGKDNQSSSKANEIRSLCKHVPLLYIGQDVVKSIDILINSCIYRRCLLK